MTEKEAVKSRRLLEPMDRISEILFGVIMVLTFTGSFSVATSGRQEVREMLIGALGCNLAWGIIDAIMYLMACLAERGRYIRILLNVHRATDPGEAHRIIADAMPSALAAITPPAEWEVMRQKLLELPQPPSRAWLNREDWLGAVAVFFLVFFSTFPVVIPFLFMHSPTSAMRVSNGVAVLMLFFAGYAFGRCAGYRGWLTGLSMVALSGILVAVTIALGG